MATTSSAKRPCCKCNKGGATFTCDGCHQSFCVKHVSDHRQELSQQMDNIGQQHDILKRDIDEQSINKILLNEIDQWEKESITKIRSSADEARINLKRITDESKIRLSDLMSKLSDELRSNRESDDYTEEDLDRWVKQFKELQKELEKPSGIEIMEDKVLPFYLIKTKKINADGNNVIDLSLQKVARDIEKFSGVSGPVVLSEDGYSAICTAGTDIFDGSTKYSSVCGRLRYSSGIHYLRFRLNTSRDSAVFFGILQSSQSIVDNSSKLNSVYGYWSSGNSMEAGSYMRSGKKIITQPNDEVLLTLDCSLRKISYVHERTQMRYEMKVQQDVCPLPWKLVVTLWYPDDKIEILSL